MKRENIPKRQIRRSGRCNNFSAKTVGALGHYGGCAERVSLSRNTNDN